MCTPAGGGGGPTPSDRQFMKTFADSFTISVLKVENLALSER